jgi:hypothetical protein
MIYPTRCIEVPTKANHNTKVVTLNYEYLNYSSILLLFHSHITTNIYCFECMNITYPQLPTINSACQQVNQSRSRTIASVHRSMVLTTAASSLVWCFRHVPWNFSSRKRDVSFALAGYVVLLSLLSFFYHELSLTERNIKVAYVIYKRKTLVNEYIRHEELKHVCNKAAVSFTVWINILIQFRSSSFVVPH